MFFGSISCRRILLLGFWGVDASEAGSDTSSVSGTTGEESEAFSARLENLFFFDSMTLSGQVHFNRLV